ncbi:hypothetical protein BVC80_9019g15 [Macleaya cordata]|uniref:Uncharacterized protein n=1 Tax=Macleaya cordata TaxID=56857 RepID=A0A200QQH2_MACCD|nr:hypothetical protein BVC80_9019g15 [Macleaya cordata]
MHINKMIMIHVHHHIFSSKWNITNHLIIIKDVIYYIFLLIFSLLSTSSVVYATACIYTTSKEIMTFKEVIIKIVPKVWERLSVTFLWNFYAVIVYNFSTILLLDFVVFIMVGGEPESATDFQLVVLLVLLLIMLHAYLIGRVYIGVVMQLASVISVLEDDDQIFGIKAMMKSKDLINGKIWMASVVFVEIRSCFTAVIFVFEKLVVHGGLDHQYSMGMVGSASLGIICSLLLAIVIQYGLVIQTLIYLVCKSYHRESINDKYRRLADHLEDQYDPLIKTVK